MNLEKFKPWNWFKHEESDNDGKRIPVSRERAGDLPFQGGSLFSLHRDMDRWFEDAFKSLGMPALQAPHRGGAGLAEFYSPQIDISADTNCYHINLDVPGLTESDLSLEVTNDALTIQGQKVEKNEDEDKHYYRMERSFGAFKRTLALPDDADADEIKAKLDKGVLRLEIPRRAGVAQDVKRISITT